jgi:nitroimidazol reductase NimA-like FMN-containing flavoprotein (pyridoxamine 5'-phosphate oxidase superfamily)
MRYRTVIGFGEAERVEDPAEKARLLAVLAAKYTGAPPAAFPPHELARTVVLRLRMRSWHGKEHP